MWGGQWQTPVPMFPDSRDGDLPQTWQVELWYSGVCVFRDLHPKWMSLLGQQDLKCRAASLLWRKSARAPRCPRSMWEPCYASPWWNEKNSIFWVFLKLLGLKYPFSEPIIEFVFANVLVCRSNSGQVYVVSPITTGDTSLVSKTWERPD